MVPLIGLFTGARQNEICQLYISDVYQEESSGIWVFDINELNSSATRKSLKRPYHARQVPIHPILIKELKFLEFVESMKSGKHDRPFPELPYDEENKYGDQLGRWFNRTYINARNCNITTAKTSFHSLRHTVINYLVRIVGCSENEISHMMGQTPSGNEGATRYVKSASLTEKKKWIDSLRFENIIDFSVIRPWEYHIFAKK